MNLTTCQIRNGIQFAKYSNVTALDAARINHTLGVTFKRNSVTGKRKVYTGATANSNTLVFYWEDKKELTYMVTSD